MPSHTPGRNDPCPCGSGRKFKQCCLQALSAGESGRLRIRALEGHVVGATFDYAVRTWGAPLVRYAWADFWNFEDVPDEIGETPEFEGMFVPWFVFDFVPDPDDDAWQQDWPVEPLAVAWLHDAAVTDSERDYVDTVCRSPLSVLRVVDLVPGRSLDVVDMLTGRSFRVLEQSASRTVSRDDAVFARVVTMGGVSVLLGMAPYTVPPSHHGAIFDFREDLEPGGNWDCATLEDFDREIRDLYFELSQALLHPPAPVLQNTDGEPFEPTRLVYGLNVPVHVAFEKLRPLAELAGESHIEAVENRPDGLVAKVAFSWVKKGNRQHKGWSNTILGRIELDDGRLVAEVNSAGRAERLMREVDKRLGLGARLSEREAIDPESVLDEAEEDSPADAETALEALQNSPEVRALLDDHLRKHWEGWIDTKIPALGGRTPRQAVKTATGRERVDALLASFERREPLAGMAEQRPHIARVRATLGLTRR